MVKTPTLAPSPTSFIWRHAAKVYHALRQFNGVLGGERKPRASSVSQSVASPNTPTKMADHYKFGLCFEGIVILNKGSCLSPEEVRLTGPEVRLLLDRAPRQELDSWQATSGNLSINFYAFPRKVNSTSGFVACQDPTASMAVSSACTFPMLPANSMLNRPSNPHSRRSRSCSFAGNGALGSSHQLYMTVTRSSFTPRASRCCLNPGDCVVIESAARYSFADQCASSLRGNSLCSMPELTTDSGQRSWTSRTIGRLL